MADFTMLRLHGRTPAKPFYVALGSSFAAGLGLGPRDPASPYISMRSVNGYPQILARRLNVPSFADMTSSGSTLRHVLHGGQMGLGPQLDALDPETRLITLTAGGNDIRFVGDLTAAAFSNRKDLMGRMIRIFWNGIKDMEARDFPSMAANLEATLNEARRRSPNAQIVVATYPRILPDVGVCPSLGLTEAQAATMRQAERRLAEVTRSVVSQSYAILVDMALLSEGRDACASQPWVNGARPVKGAAFHPTLAGAEATAGAIMNVIEPKLSAS
jgi:lysophospholipase L1-like esterase